MHHVLLPGIQEKQARAVRAGVYLLSGWMWGLGWFVAALMLFQGVSNWPLFYTHLVTGPLAWLAIWGARKGYGRAVAITLIVFILTATAGVHISGRVYTVASLMNIAVLTLFAGWVLGPWITAFVVITCQALLVLLVLDGVFSWNALLPLMYTALCLGATMVLARRAYDQHVLQLADAEQKIVEHEEYRSMLSSLVEQSPYSVAVIDLVGRLKYVNQTFLSQMGYTEEEVLGKHARDISLAGLDETTYDVMVQTVRAGGVWRGSIRTVTKRGEILTESVTITPVMDAQGHNKFYVEAKLDISERVYAQQRVQELLNYDKLTQLPNRFALARKLEDLLQQERERLGKEPTNQMRHTWHGMLLLDVEGFHHFNTANGMEWGDSLLVGIALRFQQLQSEDEQMWVARYANDQFAVVLENVGSTRMQAREEARNVALTLQGALSSIQVPGRAAVSINVRVGITVFPFVEPNAQSDSSERIVRRAMIAAVDAKQKGLQEVALYKEELAEKAEQYMKVVLGLQTALAQGQLRMFVQPQYAQNGQVVGLEALIRWQHPELGLQTPGKFIVAAENSGLVIPMGIWMLEQACALLQTEAMQKCSCTVSINISAQQFLQPGFITCVEQLLIRFSVPANRLILEVTESMLFSDIQIAVRVMQALTAMGIQLALDDFGTGYSSLSYLRTLPIQEVKIDQSFIRELTPTSSSGVLVQAVLMIAKQLGLRVVAEGLEKEEDARLLQAWDPKIVCQGYLYSKPMPVEEWVQKLASEQTQ